MLDFKSLIFQTAYLYTLDPLPLFASFGLIIAG
jgi:hypothetical protein